MNIKNYSTHTKKYKTLLSCVHSIYRLVNSTFEAKELVSRLGKLICQVFNVRYCSVVLLDTSKRYSLFKCLVSARKKHIIDRKEKISGWIEKRIIRTSTSIRQKHLLALPMVAEDIVGIIVARRNVNDPPFDSYDQQMLMTMIEQATIGIRNLQLYEEQQKIVLGSIKSITTLLDMRVPREYTHSPYFSRLVVAIANQMHVDPKQIEGLKYASLLHDTGKVDIPMKILTKTTKLTPQEYRIVKRHPIRGMQILRPLQALKPAIPVIAHHHERYDGTGYPSRLKKDQIPEGARIMAVADAFEAMVYGRPYRERKDINSAIKEIKKKSGTQFDPKVVEAFLKVAKKLNTKKYLQANRHKIYNKKK